MHTHNDVMKKTEFSPKYLFQVVKVLKKYDVIYKKDNYLPYLQISHAEQSTQESNETLMPINMKKIKEYAEIYRTLYSVHIGLENTFTRLYQIENETIPPLIKTCITMLYNFNTPIHMCFTQEKAHNWIALRIAFALCGCSIQTIRRNGVKWEKLHLNTDSILYNKKSKNEIPISIRIPTGKNTHYICTSYSCSGLENIAIGLIEVTQNKIIEKLSFTYCSHERIYILPLIESNFFIGKRYPVSSNILESFKKHIFYQFEIIKDTIGIMHINYVTEALISLLNPSLV